MGAIFTAASMQTAATFVVASMLIVVAVALAFKAGALAKRVLNSVGSEEYSPDGFDPDGDYTPVDRDGNVL